MAETAFFRACWYGRDLVTPALRADERLVVHFGAVDYVATVWIDDTMVAQHEGGHTPFSADVTSLVLTGVTHRLIVRAEDDPHDLAVRVPGDQFVSPTYVPDLVTATLDLVIDGERGVWHLANGGGVSYFEFASLAAEHAGWDKALIESCSNVDLSFRAPRPRSSVLASRRTVMVPHLEDAIARLVGR